MFIQRSLVLIMVACFLHLSVRCETESKCDTRCNREYKPLCLYNEHSGLFEPVSNKCEFNITKCHDPNWVIAYEGECKQEDLRRRSKPILHSKARKSAHGRRSHSHSDYE